MRRRPRVAAVLALLVALVGLPAIAAQDPREVRGRALFAKGQFQEALDIFANLFAEKSDPLYLRNIGRCYQKLRRPDQAIDSFQEYLRRSPNLKVTEQQEIKGFISEMEELRRRNDGRVATGPTPGERPATEPPKSPATGLPSAQRTPPGASPKGVVAPPPPLIALAAPRPSKAEADGADLTKTASNDGDPTVHDGGSSLTHQWWFWTAVGAVVAGAAVTTVLLLRHPKPDCPSDFMCQ